MITAKGDSGASHHYIRPEDANCLTNLKRNTSFKVTLPNADSIPSNVTGHLSLSPTLSTKSQHAAVLPQLKSASLISLGQLCDDDCTVELTKTDLKVRKNNKLVLSGTRNESDGLWDIPIKSQLQHNNFILPPVKGNLYKSRDSVKYNHVPPFLQSLTHLVDPTLAKLNRHSTNNNHSKIPQFMAALDPLIE
jgi:hypothetical protein